MAVAPFVSLCVIPFAFSRVRVNASDVGRDRRRRDRGGSGHRAGRGGQRPTCRSRHGTGFAVAVVAIMFSEQALMNAGVIVVAANSGFHLTLGLTGFVFNVLLIVRAPLQLFQAVQTSILPHLAGLEAQESADEFRRDRAADADGDRRLRRCRGARPACDRAVRDEDRARLPRLHLRADRPRRGRRRDGAAPRRGHAQPGAPGPGPRRRSAAVAHGSSRPPCSSPLSPPTRSPTGRAGRSRLLRRHRAAASLCCT